MFHFFASITTVRAHDQFGFFAVRASGFCDVILLTLTDYVCSVFKVTPGVNNHGVKKNFPSLPNPKFLLVSIF